jgi:hypothetical protein
MSQDQFAEMELAGGNGQDVVCNIYLSRSEYHAGNDHDAEIYQSHGLVRLLWCKQASSQNDWNGVGVSNDCKYHPSLKF